jgi:TetR/AcrR family transcriptional repressor of nem operon
MGSLMSAEYADLPEAVKVEVQTFSDVNIDWLATQLLEANITATQDSKLRAGAIFSAIAGAQLMARSRNDIKLFDELIEGYKLAGLLPSTQNSMSE